MYTELKIENEVANLYLNRPEVHNAFNEDFIKELTDQFNYLDRSENAKIIVLRGRGKSFCAGADLNWMKKMKDYSLDENIADSNNLALMFHTINNVTKPVIGVVSGAALGGGAGLVSVCDYVIATKEAEFGFTEVKLGLIPAVISPFVINKIGESFARATFLNGAKFKADKAFIMGLVHEVCEEANLEARVDALIKSFLEVGPSAQLSAKKLIKEVKNKSAESVLNLTTKAISERRVSSEAQSLMGKLLSKQSNK